MKRPTIFDPEDILVQDLKLAAGYKRIDFHLDHSKGRGKKRREKKKGGGAFKLTVKIKNCIFYR